MADKCADLLFSLGIDLVQVNAAGDVSHRGVFYDGSVKPWSIDVVNLDNHAEVVEIYEITGGAIATSGTYECGAHVHDPQTEIGAKSATVLGRKGWKCDATAIAAMVCGQESAKRFGQPELAGYQLFALNQDEESAWEI